MLTYVIKYPGSNVRHELDVRPRINRVWVEPAEPLIKLISPEVFAAFARAFNIVERIEGVQYALFWMLKSHVGADDGSNIGFENARTALVRALWGYLYEASPTLKALGIVQPTIAKTSAYDSFKELQAIAKRWSRESVVRNQMAFHPGEPATYETAIANIPPYERLVLLEEQWGSDGHVSVGARRFPFGFDLLTYGLKFGAPEEVKAVTRELEEVRAWGEDSKQNGLVIAVHLMCVFLELIRFHGVRMPSTDQRFTMFVKRTDGTTEPIDIFATSKP